jgi:hypothetical protein
MADLTKVQKTDLLEEIRRSLFDAEYSKEDSWCGDDIDFKDQCGCYSEWTTEPCSFGVTISGTLPDSEDDQWQLRRDLEERVEKWVRSNLSWTGCHCCNGEEIDKEHDGPDYLSTNVYLFSKKSKESTNA